MARGRGSIRTWMPHYHFQRLIERRLIDVPVPEVEFSRFPPPPGVTGIDLVIRLRKKM